MISEAIGRSMLAAAPARVMVGVSIVLLENGLLLESVPLVRRGLPMVGLLALRDVGPAMVLHLAAKDRQEAAPASMVRSTTDLPTLGSAENTNNGVWKS